MEVDVDDDEPWTPEPHPPQDRSVPGFHSPMANGRRADAAAFDARQPKRPRGADKDDDADYVMSSHSSSDEGYPRLRVPSGRRTRGRPRKRRACNGESSGFADTAALPAEHYVLYSDCTVVDAAGNECPFVVRHGQVVVGTDQVWRREAVTPPPLVRRHGLVLARRPGVAVPSGTRLLLSGQNTPPPGWGGGWV